MAQIRIEQRRTGLGWLWLLLAVVVVAAIVWYVLAQRNRAATGSLPSGATPAGLQYAPPSGTPVYVYT